MTFRLNLIERRTSRAVTYQDPFSPLTVDDSITFDSNAGLLAQLSGSAQTTFDQAPNNSRWSSANGARVIDIAGYTARLCKLVHNMIGLFGGFHGQVTPKAILTMFHGYTQLFDAMPPSLQRVEMSQLGGDVRSLQ